MLSPVLFVFGVCLFVVFCFVLVFFWLVGLFAFPAFLKLKTSFYSFSFTSTDLETTDYILSVLQAATFKFINEYLTITFPIYNF